MVTSIESAGPLVISGSTDKSVALWDIRWAAALADEAGQGCEGPRTGWGRRRTAGRQTVGPLLKVVSPTSSDPWFLGLQDVGPAAAGQSGG